MGTKADRDRRFAEVFAAAERAGRVACGAARPTPMIVTERMNPLDDASPVKRAWHVPEGVCGFAWITIRPGTSAAARYAVKRCGAKRAYGGGVSIWLGFEAGGMFLERKEAYAGAYAGVLRAAGIRAYSESRID
jgi:hypothetical protein